MEIINIGGGWTAIWDGGNTALIQLNGENQHRLKMDETPRYRGDVRIAVCKWIDNYLEEG
jgi:hypothetical protein